MPARILLTGGGGQLARELTRIDPSIDAPPRRDMDVSDYAAIEQYCGVTPYTVLIHAGAVTNKFERNADEEYITSNIIGTANVVLWSMRHSVRLVYLSTDYVYPGERGGYTEHSVLFPVNRYATSKLGGELAVQLYENSLIIRTSFYRELMFLRGCTDQYTSRMAIADAARAVYDLSLRAEVTGIINVGSRTKRSLFDIVRTEFVPTVVPIRRSDIAISYTLPHDSSMDTTRYEQISATGVTSSRTVNHCRICNSSDLVVYLAMGQTPLANSYLSGEDRDKPEFTEELALQVCLSCGLSQLTRVVHPDMMFRNYLYVSSTTQTFRDHCDEMSSTLLQASGAAPGALVLDIASNDGCLLSKFRDRGMNVIGVDPAENLAREANASGIRTLCAYWSPTIARDIVARFGRPLIVTATNVFAHVDDVHGFVDAVTVCLADRGIFVIECPYLVDFIDRNEFDTAYHEHLSYLAVSPLTRLMEAHGLRVFHVEYFRDLHGGTIRVYVCRDGDHPVTGDVAGYHAREQEFGLFDRSLYTAFAARVQTNKEQLRMLIATLRAEGKTIWAYGASAKGNTLMNFFELTARDVPTVIDDNPKKWGMYTPGSRMHIVGIDQLAHHRVDFLLLLAWNFQAEIIRRSAAAGFAGRFITPVPVPAVLDAHP